MKRHIWRSIVGLTSAIVVLAALGCAGGLVSRDVSATATLSGYSLETDSNVGTVDGYVYVPLAQHRQGNGLLESDSPTPPAGYRPAEGAECTWDTHTVFTDAYGYYIFRGLAASTIQVTISYGGETITKQKTVVLHGRGTYKYYVNMAQVATDWAERRNRIKNVNRVNIGYNYVNSTPGEQAVTLRLYVSDNGSLTRDDIATASDAVLIHEATLEPGAAQIGIETDNIINDDSLKQQLLSDRFFIYAIGSPPEATVAVSNFVFDMEIRVGL